MPSKMAKELLKKHPGSRMFDAAELLTTPKRIAAYLEIAIDEANGDTAEILHALNTAARARNVTELAREAGLTRQGLYKALAPEGNPSFDTVQKLLRSFGLTLSSKPAV